MSIIHSMQHIESLSQYVQTICDIDNRIKEFSGIGLPNSTVMKSQILNSFIESIQLDNKHPGTRSKQAEVEGSYLTEYLESLQAKLTLSNQGSPKGSHKIFYRGESNIKWRPTPQIMRKNVETGREYLLNEDRYSREIKVRCPSDFQGLTHLDHLVKMQHYGCPTRLLDITSNPLVALYFACSSKSELHNEGVVYIFCPPQNEVLSFDSDKALILSSLALMSSKEKEQVFDECLDKIYAGKIFDSTRGSRVIEKLYHEIRRENPSFERKIDPFDLLSVFFVRPLLQNERIIKQDGSFIICGLSRDVAEIQKVICSLVVGEIHITNKIKILQELESVDICEATLFPEVDMVSNYLKSKF